MLKLKQNYLATQDSKFSGKDNLNMPRTATYIDHTTQQNSLTTLPDASL